MEDALTIYFNGEKYAGLILAAIALTAIVTAIVLFRANADLRSFAITLAVVATAEIGLGVGLYVRTGPQVERLAEQLRSEAAGVRAAETIRMTRVQRNFVVIEYVELCLIGVTAIAAFLLKVRPGPSGVALGLLINASLLLAFDLLAERRGDQYVTALARTNLSR